MELKELKDKIENNTLDKDLLIFKYSGNGDFIVHQYLSQYRKNNNLDIEHIESLNDLGSDMLFGVSKDIIKFCEVDSLEDFNSSDKVWIKCKKISAKLATKFADNIVDIPKIEEWQIKDYISANLTKFADKDIELFLESYKSDLYRLENEIDKIKIFEEKSRKAVFNQIKNQLFLGIEAYSTFDLVNAIINRDKAKLIEAYSNIDSSEQNPFGLVELLLINFKHVIDVQLAKNPTAESVGVSRKQFWAIQKFSCGHYSKEELIYIYRMLLSINYKVKSGQLDTDLIFDYIICRILAL